MRMKLRKNKDNHPAFNRFKVIFLETLTGHLLYQKRTAATGAGALFNTIDSELSKYQSCTNESGEKPAYGMTAQQGKE